MESSDLSCKLSNSSSYRREKTFRYPISRESTIYSPNKHQAVREESSSPASILHPVHYRACPTDPNLFPIPLRSSDTFQSIPSRICLNKIQLDLSPCKPDSSLKQALTPVQTVSRNSESPLPKGVSPVIYDSFSRAVEKLNKANHDFALPSGRSGLYGRESCEISAISEENSEHPQCTNPSIIQAMKNNETSRLESDSSDIHYSEELVCALSVPANYKKESSLSMPRTSASIRFRESEKNLLSLTFEEAISLFKNLNLEFLPDHLFISSWKDVICCKKSDLLENENLEICEKLIVFTYLGFTNSDLFHNRLLVSVFEILSRSNIGKKNWTDVGFSNDNPFESDLKHDAATLGLLQVLFLENYMPDFLEECLGYCLEHNMAFVMISFDMSEISVMMLRKKMLNSLINQSSKAIEVIFFVFAGCLSFWFTLHKSQNALPGEINYLVERLALKDPEFLIKLAKEKWEYDGM